MKFEYKDNNRDCVAYLHSSGILMFRCVNAFDMQGMEQKVVSMGRGNVVSTNGTANLEKVISNDLDQGKRFYPGDKITITFEE